MVLATHPHVCVACGKAVDVNAPPLTFYAAEIDHKIPYSLNKGLEFDPDNAQVLCSPCNKRKGSRQYYVNAPTPARPTPTWICFAHTDCPAALRLPGASPHSRCWSGPDICVYDHRPEYLEWWEEHKRNFKERGTVEVANGIAMCY
ncbi:HNH endonuclease [Georgenia sp. AZ-5]|uniref:HNH endonuclease n=1 Tax=Georgenia sp. AZ-5 TaxID=3367526 RepID=UPI003755215F